MAFLANGLGKAHHRTPAKSRPMTSIMKVLLQRVSQAEVVVEGNQVGSIGTGFLLLVGIGPDDNLETAQGMAKKVVGLRIFPDESGKMNHDVLTSGGGILVVSQFTLYADCKKGRRPSFTGAASPGIAADLVREFVLAIRKEGVVQVEEGVFGAEMSVSLVNEGPVTLWLDSHELGIA